MAKPIILKERGTGEEIYPHTLASLVHTSTGKNVEEAVDEAKFKVFVDIFNTKCIKPEWGRYDPDNAPDAQHPFFLNKLWLTYDEAVKAVAASNWMFSKSLTLAISLISDDIGVRTVMPIGLKSGDALNLHGFAANNRNIEVIRLFTNTSVFPYISQITYAFNGCNKLKKIIGILRLASNVEGLVIQAPFGYCYELKDVNISNLCKDLMIRDSPKLSRLSPIPRRQRCEHYRYHGHGSRRCLRQAHRRHDQRGGCGADRGRGGGMAAGVGRRQR